MMPAGTPHIAAIYASLDVGTNSVKLTVADLAGGDARCLCDRAVITRLGEGMLAHGHRLREVPMRRTLDAIADFVALAQVQGARQIAAVGTAALREAANRDEFLRRVRERCGITIDVLSGEEEARLSYLAVRRDPHWRAYAGLIVIDVGGGSTEIIQGEAHSSRIATRQSVNLGAVKLTERYFKSDPPTIAQLAAANQVVAEEFDRMALNPVAGGTQVVGVGGTVTNLASMDLQGTRPLEQLHGHTLQADALEDLTARLASRTIQERKQIPGLDPARADVILGGAIILSQALAHLGSAALDVSTRGLRWGVLYDRFLPAEG
ncbi:MAG TPA: hypothetical protein VFB38_21510 [Chthonomonadaceae bacterium]|nr:hypothetical protein [Chthonomonadaceae bacterium]